MFDFIKKDFPSQLFIGCMIGLSLMFAFSERFDDAAFPLVTLCIYLLRYKFIYKKTVPVQRKKPFDLYDWAGIIGIISSVIFAIAEPLAWISVMIFVVVLTRRLMVLEATE